MGGYNMPDQYRCDSCKAVIFHLNQALQKAQPKNRRLQEWEYQDVFDDTCTPKSFEGYGIKLINGVNTLSGIGLKHNDRLEPGQAAIQMSSDTWSNRLAEICRTLV